MPHGGVAYPTITLSADDHFMLRIGSRYLPICHTMLGMGHGGRIGHLDGNTWNSHPDNLAIVEGDAHKRRNRWSYGYRELADLFGLSEDGTRQAVSRGQFNPASLDSITSFWWLRHPKDP